MMKTTFYNYALTTLLCMLISKSSGSTLNDATNLHDALFTKTSYNRNIRGLAEQGGSVRVGASFSVVSLGEVMEREEAFSVMGLLYLSWMDERLIWDADDYNGTSEIVVYQDTIWKPEVKLANPMLKVYALGSDRSQVRISSTGQVDWAIPDMYTASCDIDVVSFPWDRQQCALDFIVSAYFSHEVVIEAESDHIEVLEKSEQWQIIGTRAITIPDKVSRVRFWLCLERRASYQFAVKCVPIICLSFLNLFVFFVKVGSGERISFAITLFLSITLYLSLVANNLPTHSKRMASIIYCVDFVLLESMAICIMSIYSMHVYHKQGVPPITCQRIVMKLLGRGYGKVQHKCVCDKEQKDFICSKAYQECGCGKTHQECECVKLPYTCGSANVHQEFGRSQAHPEGGLDKACQKCGCGKVQRESDCGKRNCDSDGTVLASNDNEGPEYLEGSGVDQIGVGNVCVTWMDVSLLIDRVFSVLASVAIVTSFIVFATFVVSNRTECM